MKKQDFENKNSEQNYKNTAVKVCNEKLKLLVSVLIISFY